MSNNKSAGFFDSALLSLDVGVWNKMKILFINLPYQGHVIPTIGLVKELMKQGCCVTYLLPFEWKKMLDGTGVEFVGYPNHKKLSEQIKNAYAAAEQFVQGYDLVIYEQFFFLGKHLAEKYNKPAVRIFTAPVTNEKLMQEYINAGGALGLFRYRWIGKNWTKSVAKGISLKTDCWLDEIVQNPPDLNLVYTLDEYQPYREEFEDEKYKFLGASIFDREHEKFEISKKGLPVIYISLGTVIKGATIFFKRCVQAFEKEDVTVILSVGKQFDIRKLGKIPGNFHVYQTVPQLSVLKQADVFVTHGGMNSVSEALVCGVPMVVIPFMADQPTNARRIEELGLGKRLDYKEVSSELLKQTVLELFTDKELQERVAGMKEKMENCPGNQGGVKYILDYYETDCQSREK